MNLARKMTAPFALVLGVVVMAPVFAAPQQDAAQGALKKLDEISALLGKIEQRMVSEQGSSTTRTVIAAPTTTKAVSTTDSTAKNAKAGAKKATTPKKKKDGK